THHAHADRGAGYCVFNDTAVASRLMQAEWRRDGSAASAGRDCPLLGDRPHHLQVAVIDLDVHQGDGTARIFEGDESVFTLSLHGRSNYPFAKARSDLDLDLPDGCGDAEYLGALQGALAQLEHRFVPGLVIYLAGADPYAGDRLGRLALSAEGLCARDRQVFQWCFERAIPVAMTMAGGYADPIDSTVQIQLNSFQVALDFAGRWRQAEAAR
ncbi:MAG: histone deacetylase, partial [Rhodoferax sp.]|nr:histone deacetylase [Rhodoferax sp.]